MTVTIWVLAIVSQLLAISVASAKHSKRSAASSSSSSDSSSRDLALFGTVFYEIPETLAYNSEEDAEKMYCTPRFTNIRSQCPHLTKAELDWGMPVGSAAWGYAATQQSPRYCVDDVWWVSNFGNNVGPTPFLRGKGANGGEEGNIFIPPVALVLAQRQRHRHDIAIMARRNPDRNLLVLEVGCNKRDSRTCGLAMQALTLMSSHCARCRRPTIFVHRPAESKLYPALDNRVTVSAYTSAVGGAMVFPLHISVESFEELRRHQLARLRLLWDMDTAKRLASRKAAHPPADGDNTTNQTSAAAARNASAEVPLRLPSLNLQPVVAAMWEGFSSVLRVSGLNSEDYIWPDVHSLDGELQEVDTNTPATKPSSPDAQRLVNNFTLYRFHEPKTYEVHPTSSSHLRHLNATSQLLLTRYGTIGNLDPEVDSITDADALLELRVRLQAQLEGVGDFLKGEMPGSKSIADTAQEVGGGKQDKGKRKGFLAFLMALSEGQGPMSHPFIHIPYLMEGFSLAVCIGILHQRAARREQRRKAKD